jgi:hypothetical protein
MKSLSVCATAFAAIGLLISHRSASGQSIVLLSDSFSRTVGEAPILGPGDPLDTDWGVNDNAAGGTIIQTYEVSNQHVDATSTWRSGALVDGSKGQLGYAHAEIQHDWAADPAVLAAGKLIVEFDLILAGGAGGGHLGWWFGAAEAVFEETNGASQGGTPVLNSNVDAAVFFRVGGGTGGSIDSGVTVNNSFTISPAMSTTNPNQIRLEINTGDFQNGSPASLSLFINGSATPTDINGAAAGADLNFVWDAEGEAYMGFSRNSSPTLLSIDNLKISTLAAAPANNADFNSDGIVDGQDFLIWQRGLGLTGQTGKSNGNANSDTVVDGADLEIWRASFGGPGAAVAVFAVPEPSQAALLGALAVAFASVWRRRGTALGS